MVTDHYCAPCYAARYLKPPQHDPGFPRPKLRLKHWLILVAVFAVLNCIVASFMRSGLLQGTPAQLRQWTSYAFLFANAFATAYIVLLYALKWLQRVIWYRRTGGLIPPPGPRRLTRKQLLAFIGWAGFMSIWCFIAGRLTEWLTPKIWPIQKTNMLLLLLLMLSPSVFVLLARHRYSRDRLASIRREWQLASRPERAWKMFSICWVVVLFGALLGIPMGFLRGGSFWINVVFLVGILFATPIVILAGAALTTQRR